MKNNKKKKTLKISLFSSFFAISSVLATSVTLASCAKKDDIKIPSATAGTFSSLYSNIYPTIAGVLSSQSGRESLIKSYVNKLLFRWFEVVNESSLETSSKDWRKNAEKSYNSEYDSYKKNKGRNWEQLFQQNVLDPVGGTREDFITDRIINNIKGKFIDNLFSTSSKDYLAYKSNGNSIIPIKELDDTNSLSDIDNKYVNATTTGTKNNFLFTGEAVPEVDRKTIDLGLGDFMEFLMDEWIRDEMPLPLSMSLWKNGTSEVKIKQLFSNFFTQNKTPEGFAEGSYNFQYFEPIDKDDLQKLTTTSKFKLLTTKLAEGSYSSQTTGLIKLNTQYTEDSSTTLIVPVNKLFDGTYVTPFSAAAWYKFSNKVFGITDANVQTLTELDSESIMKNFLVYKNTSSNKSYQNSSTNNKGVFNFPYPVEWDNSITQQKGSVFLGEYKDAIGIRDFVDLDKNTKIKGQTSSGASSTPSKSLLDNFSLVRNTFGVHLVGIDRLSKLSEAYGTPTTATNFNDGYQKVLNELRNTFIYYLALDTRSGSDTYKVKESLKTYLSDNFESVVYRYVKKYIDNPSANVDNLLGAKITSNNKNGTIDYNNNFGFINEENGKSYKNYYDVLNELKKGNSNANNLRALLDNSEKIKYAKKALDFNIQMKDAIYENQAKYNSNTSATSWIDNGIAGVLPFERDGSNGYFKSLAKLVDSIVSNTKPTTTIKKNNHYINTKATSQLSVIGNDVTTINNTSTYYEKSKYDYQTSIVNYVNSINLVVDPKKQTGISTYIFTNDYYVNKALLVTGSDGTLNSIVYNSYIQRSIYPKGTTVSNSTNKLLNYSKNTIGSTGWIAEKIKNSIKSTYLVNKFSNIKNLYSEGDWTDYNGFLTKAETHWNNNWNRDEFKYSITNNSSTPFGFNTYTKPSDSEEYFKFMITIKYLLSWNNKKQTFEFTKIHDILEKATRITNSNTGKAMIAWQNMSSIVANPSFGISSSMTVENIQKKVQEDSSFKALPIYLTNSNSYSWLGQVNPYALGDASNRNNKLTKKDISYTTSTNYWYTSPMKVVNSLNGQTTSTANTGFLGFQLEDTSESGTTNSLPTLAFENSTYSNAISNSNNNIISETVKYRGMFYSFKTRDNLSQYVKNLSTVNLLTDFYNKNLKNSGLPISESIKKKISEIIDGTEDNRVQLLQTELEKILNDQNQLPNVVFDKMISMPLWNSENNVNSTLFATSDETQALKNEYIITQFNSLDVEKLITKNENNDGSTTITLNSDETTGFLGVGSETFFNAVIMMANSSSKLQSQAMDAMFRETGKIEIFDIRLLNVIDKNWISNYDTWKKVKDLS